MASKIIVLGDVNGQLKPVFAKLSTLHAKNSFSLAIVTGNLFLDDNEAVFDLLEGRIDIPLPTYFTVGTNVLPPGVVDKIKKNEEICHNLHYLGKRSTTKTSEGIKIVTLGGQLDEGIIGGMSKEQHLPFHTVGDAKSLHGGHNADILITTLWPASVRTGSKVPLPDGVQDITEKEYIADLCAALKPRYHFSVSPDFFYEREPFFHPPAQDAPDSRPLTRFISLAAYGNSLKEKSLYAFSLQTSADPTAPLPPGATASPLLCKPNPKKRALEPDLYSRYDNQRGGGRRNKRYQDRRPLPGPGECFFCLSNPNLATHLISSIGDDSYLTIAKGPLTTSETNASVGIDFPGHALIVPLTHSPTLALIAGEDNAKEKTYAEMNRFKDTLQSMIAKCSGNKLGAVTYEISKGNMVHFHWQFIPIPEDLIKKGLVEAAFRVESENLNYPPFEARDPGIGQNEGDFFRVWIWTPPTESEPQGSTKCLTMPFDDRIRFSLQFGRIALAKLLGLQKREQWRDCSQTIAEEEKDLQAFKSAFKNYDFTL